MLATPGLTALRDPEEARRRLLEEALLALPLVRASPGAVIDVGSGGGSPGIPIAATLPGRPVTLLEAQRRKSEFLRGFANELPNVQVVWGRAEEQPIESFGVALAKALARPPVAAELTLPLVEPPGIAVLWVGKSANAEAVARVAGQLGARLADSPPGLFVLRKVERTPPGFPRRAGLASKRPLA